MPKIFDNIENHVVQGLNNTLEVSYRGDFCVGYFNLRGWKQVAVQIDNLKGDDGNCCRLLIGMQKPPLEILREYFYKPEQDIIDNQTASAIKRKLAQEFKDQLTIGIPAEEDEIGLRKLSQQIKNKKLIVKLFLRHPLHATFKRGYCILPAFGRFARLVPFIEKPRSVRVIDYAEPELFRIRTEAASTSGNLLEGHYRGNGLHEDNIAHARRINAGGQKANGRRYNGCRAFRILEFLKYRQLKPCGKCAQ